MYGCHKPSRLDWPSEPSEELEDLICICFPFFRYFGAAIKVSVKVNAV